MSIRDALIVLLIVAGVASRPIEVRLWRAGRLSNRAVTILLLARTPVLLFFIFLIVGYDLGFIVVVTLAAAFAMVAAYRFTLGLVTEQARERDRLQRAIATAEHQD
jgi:hypothetical protein